MNDEEDRKLFVGGLPQDGTQDEIKVNFFSTLCCGSGSALMWLFWIRIRIGNEDPDPGARKFTKINKQTWFSAVLQIRDVYPVADFFSIPDPHQRI
jgi:hypothetical protein